MSVLLERPPDSAKSEVSPADAPRSPFPIAPPPTVRPATSKPRPTWPLPMSLPAEAAALIAVTSSPALSAAPAFRAIEPETPPWRAPQSAIACAIHSVQADELLQGSSPNGSLKLMGLFPA